MRILLTAIFSVSLVLSFAEIALAEKAAVHGLTIHKFGRHGITAMQRQRLLRKK